MKRRLFAIGALAALGLAGSVRAAVPVSDDAGTIGIRPVPSMAGTMQAPPASGEPAPMPKSDGNAVAPVHPHGPIAHQGAPCDSGCDTGCDSCCSHRWVAGIGFYYVKPTW